MFAAWLNFFAAVYEELTASRYGVIAPELRSDTIIEAKVTVMKDGVPFVIFHGTAPLIEMEDQKS